MLIIPVWPDMSHDVLTPWFLGVITEIINELYFKDILMIGILRISWVTLIIWNA